MTSSVPECFRLRFRGVTSSTSEAQQRDKVELTLIQVDTTRNDYQATPNDFESSSPGGYGQYMQVTPHRSYKVEDFVGEDVKVHTNCVVEDGKGQDNIVFQDGQGIVNVVVKEAVEVPNMQVQQVRPISDILKRIRRRKLERIMKIKLGKTVGGVNDT
ncbi:unnamed protein product [Lactuca saligna]|uniref:Uncharacterized protein n=1 Tax=Lactuca saligna TaxID=75948 RepID=A0AA36A251_LACSI|nr:unnamed protein product [Lactuca saligna]